MDVDSFNHHSSIVIRHAKGGHEVAVFIGIFTCIMPANKSGCQILFHRDLD